MKVAAIQHDIVWEDAVATIAHVAPMIAQAVADGARLVVLTEMFETGFSMRPESVAEDEGGPAEQFLLAQAREHGVHLVASIAQRDPGGRYRNNCVVAGPHGVVARYPKIHPFSYAREHEYYAAGDKHVVAEIEGMRFALFVCYDLRFADEFWALATDVDAYIVPANWPGSRREHWRALLRARAIENQAYVIGVNRVGRTGNLTYVGDSAIIDPLGQILAEGGADEQVLAADVDAGVIAQVRQEFPFLPDRR